jgi:hypothetical protein
MACLIGFHHLLYEKMEKPEPKASQAFWFGLFGTDQADKVPGSIIGLQVRCFNPG